MTWSVYRSTTPGIMWARYGEAIGLDNLKRIFGDHWPPKEARPLEEVYVWRDESERRPPFNIADHPAAWLSLSIDQHDPSNAYMSRGVWPDQHGKGLGKLMRAFAESWCMSHGVDTLNIGVDSSNKEHLANVMRDPYWVHDSLSWDGDGNVSFGFSHVIEGVNDAPEAVRHLHRWEVDRVAATAEGEGASARVGTPCDGHVA